MLLRGKKILIGISGGIAAYKICELVRLFKKEEAEVRVIMTPSAVNFVSPVTLSTLSGNEVLINIFPQNDPSQAETIETKTWHVNAGVWADVFIIAPATANTIAKMSAGISDNFLTATILASRCPVITAPSMDEDMYNNEITQRNISAIKEFGYIVMEPETGELASGLYGIGRMPEPENILKFTGEFLKNFRQDLKGKIILVTAGPTYEPIDAVRFIGNYSTGKMGFQIAKAATQRGAEVTLITGPSILRTPVRVKRIDTNTADEMYNAVKSHYKEFDTIIMSAAVADYKPKVRHQGKIKKDGNEPPVIETELTKDILDFLGKNKDSAKLVGFALETDNEIENAKKKLTSKNLDLIVINNPNTEGAGFGTDTNIISIMDKNMNISKYALMSKFDAANIILDKLLTL